MSAALPSCHWVKRGHVFGQRRSLPTPLASANFGRKILFYFGTNLEPSDPLGAVCVIPLGALSLHCQAFDLIECVDCYEMTAIHVTSVQKSITGPLKSLNQCAMV